MKKLPQPLLPDANTNKRKTSLSRFTTLLLVVLGCTALCNCTFKGCNPSLNPPPDSSALPPFVIEIDTSSTTGTIATVFELTAKIINPQGGTSDHVFFWDFGDGRPYAEGTTVAVQYTTPGVYPVEVKLDNGKGDVVRGGIVLSVTDPSTQRPTLLGVTLGDVNFDKRINFTDWEIVEKHAYGLEIISSSDAIVAADINLDGLISSTDAELLYQMLTAPKPWPSALTTYLGSPGTVITILSPYLLDMTIEPVLAIDNSSIPSQTLYFWRSMPGYASFMIPPDIAGPDPSAIVAQDVNIYMRVNGAIVESHRFNLIPTPKTTMPPGRYVVESLESIDNHFANLEVALESYMKNINASNEEAAVHHAIFMSAKEDVLLAKHELLRAIELLDEEHLKKLEQIALANHMPNPVQSLNIRSVPLSSQTCRPTMHDYGLALKAVASDLLAPLAESLFTACFGVALAATKYPSLVVVAAQCGTASSALLVGVNTMEIITDFLPGIEKILLVTSSQISLRPGESSNVLVRGRYTGIKDFCNTSSRLLADRFRDKLLKIFGKGPFVSKMAFNVVKHFPLELRTRQLRQFFLERINKYINLALGAVMDAGAIGGLLDSSKAKICSLLPASNSTLEFEIPTCGLKKFTTWGEGLTGTLMPSQGVGRYTVPQGCSSNDIVYILAEYEIPFTGLKGAGSDRVLHFCDGKRYAGTLTVESVSRANIMQIWYETWWLNVHLVIGRKAYAVLDGSIQHRPESGGYGREYRQNVSLYVPLLAGRDSFEGESDVKGCHNALLYGTFAEELASGDMYAFSNTSGCSRPIIYGGGSFVLNSY